MQRLMKTASRVQQGQKLHGRKTYYNVIDRLNPRRENLWLAK